MLRRVVTCLLALSLLDISCGSGGIVDKSARYISVTKVVDGDTFWVDDGSVKRLNMLTNLLKWNEEHETGTGVFGMKKTFIRKKNINDRLSTS